MTAKRRSSKGQTKTISCSDCFEFMKSIPDQSIDMVATDPPYNTTNLEFECEIDWARWWGEINRITTQNAVIAMFSAQPFTTVLINSNVKAFRYDLVWHKTMPVGWLSARKRPLRTHETICIFSRAGQGSHVYNPIMTTGKRHTNKISHRPAHYGNSRGKPGTITYKGSSYYPRSVLKFAQRNGKKSFHPTAKPVALMKWLIYTYSNPGQTVFDPFMGSGSTGLAALPLRRNFIGCEKDPIYFRLASRRIDDLPCEPSDSFEKHLLEITAAMFQ